MTAPLTAGSPAIAGDMTDALEQLVQDELDGLTWSDWPPTLTNLTQGSGTVVARYIQVGTTVHYEFVFVLGSGSSVGTGPTFTLPVAPSSTVYRTRSPIGHGTIEDNGSADYQAVARWSGSGSVCDIVVVGASVTYANHIGVTASVPFAFGTTDWLHVAGTYEAAA